MPFKSKAQMRWMFAKHPNMAKRWAKHTKRPKSLPERTTEKKALTDRGEPKVDQNLTKLPKMIAPAKLMQPAIATLARQTAPRIPPSYRPNSMQGQPGWQFNLPSIAAQVATDPVQKMKHQVLQKVSYLINKEDAINEINRFETASLLANLIEDKPTIKSAQEPASGGYDIGALYRPRITGDMKLPLGMATGGLMSSLLKPHQIPTPLDYSVPGLTMAQPTTGLPKIQPIKQPSNSITASAPKPSPAPAKPVSSPSAQKTSSIIARLLAIKP